jgi:hypothetical protein
MIAGVEVNENVVKLVIGLLITAWALVKLLTTKEYPVPPAGGAIVITGESMPHYTQRPYKYPFRSPPRIRRTVD